MACGTPVIAFSAASVPEVIEDGVTGLIVRNVDEAVAALERIPTLERRLVRKTFERRFTVERMAHDYLNIYRSLPGVRRDADRFLPLPLALVPEPLLRAAQ
jgi:glycosyltransferase involved in cell wall biosynthesis